MIDIASIFNGISEINKSENQKITLGNYPK